MSAKFLRNMSYISVALPLKSICIQWSRDSCSFKKVMLSSLKSLFLIILKTPFQFFFSVNCIDKNIRKWSETSYLITPFLKELLKIFVVKVLSIVINKTCRIFWDSCTTCRTIYHKNGAFFKNNIIKIFYFSIIMAAETIISKSSNL